MKNLVWLVLGVLMLAACAPAAGGEGITISDPWVRAPGANGGAFMVIQNGGAEADRLLSASSEVAQTVEVHETKMENDVMTMREMEGGLEIPARGSVKLAPGGYHIMLINLKQELKPGDTVTLTLNFEKAGAITVQAEVKAP
ncbi:MAG: copper chaperone PCu(A)C [Anaerolineales bacterium]